MKKWLIFAVIAAVFAMVMFPACGGDDGDGGPSASNVIAKVLTVPVVEADGTTSVTGTGAILITWEGGAGYDYYFILQEKSDLPQTAGGSEISRGQNLYAYEPVTVDGTVTKYKRVLNQDKGQWAVLLFEDTDTPANGFTDYKNFYTALVALPSVTAGEAALGRFGVAAANPGGFPLERVTIQWDIEDEDTPGDDPVPIKQSGYLSINVPNGT
jgi:hypothetical protein